MLTWAIPACEIASVELEALCQQSLASIRPFKVHPHADTAGNMSDAGASWIFICGPGEPLLNVTTTSGSHLNCT
jgi:hypothetical protein